MWEGGLFMLPSVLNGIFIVISLAHPHTLSPDGLQKIEFPLITFPLSFSGSSHHRIQIPHILNINFGKGVKL